MPALQPTVGTPIIYIPVEFPKAGRNKFQQSAMAKDPDHQKALESAGFEFPVFVPNSGRTDGLDGTGNRVQEYPKCLHGPDGKTAVARDPGHEAELGKSGWRDIPYPTEPKGPQQPLQYSASSPSGPLTDALLQEITDLKARLAASESDKHASAVALANTVAERDALKAKLETASNLNKAALQRQLDQTQAELDELKMTHTELLKIVQAGG